MSSPPLNILISGSGIAGPSLAFWLSRLIPTSKITIVERSPEPRLGGQAIDLRSSCIPIVKKMGLLDKVKELNTTEVGMQFVYRDGKRRATFEATGEEERQSGTYTIHSVPVPSKPSANYRSNERIRNPARRHGPHPLRRHKRQSKHILCL